MGAANGWFADLQNALQMAAAHTAACALCVDRDDLPRYLGGAGQSVTGV